jgi:hypothetical protein
MGNRNQVSFLSNLTGKKTAVLLSYQAVVIFQCRPGNGLIVNKTRLWIVLIT